MYLTIWHVGESYVMHIHSFYFFRDKVKKIHATTMGIKQTQDLSRETNEKEQLGRSRIKLKDMTKMNLKSKS